MASFGVSPTKACPSNESPSKRELTFVSESPPSHKKLRDSPAYKSEADIRDFYQKLEAERIRQIEKKEDGGDDESYGMNSLAMPFLCH